MNTSKFGLLARCFSAALLYVVTFASIPLNAAAEVVIDFGTGLAGPGGTLVSDGTHVVGTDILIGSLTVEGTDNADGTYIADALLNFDTEANTISIYGSVSNLVGESELLKGTFVDSGYSTPYPGTQVFWGQGPDTKGFDLLTALGVPTDTPFDFFGFSIQSANGTVVSTDIVNTALVPIPTAAWLFGSSLLGLTGVARWKSQRRRMTS